MNKKIETFDKEMDKLIRDAFGDGAYLEHENGDRVEDMFAESPPPKPPPSTTHHDPNERCPHTFQGVPNRCIKCFKEDKSDCYVFENGGILWKRIEGREPRINPSLFCSEHEIYPCPLCLEGK